LNRAGKFINEDSTPEIGYGWRSRWVNTSISYTLHQDLLTSNDFYDINHELHFVTS